MPGSSTTETSGRTSTTAPGTAPTPTPTETTPPLPLTPGVQCDFIDCPAGVEETETTPTPEDAPPVTLNDIGTFHPVGAASSMQPNGWMVIGLHANFASTAAQHVVAGTILGRHAEVRFTPTQWHWNYGDGATRNSTVPGSTWDALGIAEFSATETSHAYARAGTFEISVGVDYTAEYRYGEGAWTAIAGTVTQQQAPLRATAGTASTVLVGADCAGKPNAPGC